MRVQLRLMTSDPLAAARQRAIELFAGSDPLIFVRELVQNAIDADTMEIDVSVAFEAAAGGGGISEIRVDDWGRGMDREALVQRFLQPFSPPDDGDLARIGAYGVGFWSVFTLDPDLVCVDTARAGERWRVLFERGEAPLVLPRDDPGDGTHVRIYKRGDARSHAALREGLKRVLWRWCRFVEVDLRFEGAPVHETFGVPGRVAVEQVDSVAHIVAAHTDAASSLIAFHNAGLLIEEREESASWSGLAVRVSSPYLQHTSSRDGVQKDDGYARVMKRIEALVQGPLRARALETLVQASATDPSSGAFDDAAAAFAWHARRPGFQLGDDASAEVLRTPAGVPVDAGRLARLRAGDRVLVAQAPSALALELSAREHLVVAGPLAAVAPLVLALAGQEIEVVDADAAHAFVETLDPAASAELIATCDHLAGLLRALGWDVQRIGPAQGFGVEGGLLATEPDDGLARRVVASRTGPPVDALVIAADDPRVQAALVHAARSPRYAAYELAKAIFAPAGLDADLETELLRAALGEG